MFFIQQESIPSLYVKNCHRLANPTPDLKIRFWAHFCGIIFYKKNAFKNFRRQIMFDFLTFAQCWILHCPKSVRIRSSSGLHFSCIFPHSDWIRLRISPYSVRMRENTGKMRTRITPNTDSFYSVLFSCIVQSLSRFKSFTKISIIIILYIPQRSLVGSIDSSVYSIDSCKTSILMGITWTEIRKKP